MKPEYYVIIGFAVIAVVSVLFWIINQKHSLKQSSSIEKAIYDVVPQAIVVKHNHFFHFQIETETNTILIKVVMFHPKHEIIITNQYYWCINNNPRNWKRSATPILVPNVKKFVDFKVQSSKKITKVGLITPDCHNITRYLNESDVEVVRPNDLVYGVHLMRLSDLPIFLQKLERK
jgi:hypothetical protein